MDINVSQVSQNIAQPSVSSTLETAKNEKVTQVVTTDSQQQVKDLFAPAEINKEEMNSQAIDRQNVSEATDEQVKTTVLLLTEILRTNNRQLSFSVDEGSNKQVVKVTDSATGDIIRQIPTEEVLKFSERLQDLQLDEGTVVGLLFNGQV
jgi:flagellar protein FlaG